MNITHVVVFSFLIRYHDLHSFCRTLSIIWWCSARISSNSFLTFISSSSCSTIFLQRYINIQMYNTSLHKYDAAYATFKCKLSGHLSVIQILPQLCSFLMSQYVENDRHRVTQTTDNEQAPNVNMLGRQQNISYSRGQDVHVWRANTFIKFLPEKLYPFLLGLRFIGL